MSAPPQVRQALEAAYRKTRYVVETAEGEIAVVIGSCAPAMDRSLARIGATGGVFLTAWNPDGRWRERGLNEIAQAQLDAGLAACGYARSPTRHQAEDPIWSEAGSFIAGLDVETARSWARAFGQFAFVTVASRQPARLVWVVPPSAHLFTD